MNFQINKLNKFLKISLDSADLVETFDTILKDRLEFALDELKGYREIIDPDDLYYLTDENKEKIKEFFEKLLDEVEE